MRRTTRTRNGCRILADGETKRKKNRLNSAQNWKSGQPPVPQRPRANGAALTALPALRTREGLLHCQLTVTSHQRPAGISAHLFAPNLFLNPPKFSPTFCASQVPLSNKAASLASALPSCGAKSVSPTLWGEGGGPPWEGVGSRSGTRYRYLTHTPGAFGSTLGRGRTSDIFSQPLLSMASLFGRKGTAVLETRTETARQASVTS